MTHCSIDIETFSECELKSAGLFRYSEHGSTSIHTVCYRFDDGPVNIWIPMDLKDVPEAALPLEDEMDEGGVLYVQTDCPDDIYDHALAGCQFRAWNAMFERRLLNSKAGQRIGFPDTSVEQWLCTMAKAQAASLPAALKYCADACNTHPKDEAGRQPMMQLSKPRKPSKTDPDTRWTMQKHPNKWRSLFHYCMDDVRAESALDKYIPDLRKREVRAYHLDQRINDRGIRVDLESVDNAQILIDKYKDHLKALCVDWTGLTPGQTAELGNWVREQGFDIENLQKATITEAIEGDKVDGVVKKVLKLFSTFNMKAPTKYKAMKRAVCGDGRLRGMFLYHGAGTGRWSSRIVQLQNLFRPIIKDTADAIEAFRIHSLDWIRTLWAENPMKIFASCVRGMLIASTGCRLMCLDYASIEARVIAWLAGQEDLLEAFFNGADVYILTAAKIYGIDPDDVTDDQRFIGKIAVLSLGYQGGYRAFMKMAKNYGVKIDRAFAEQIKTDWRKANPKIVRLWDDMEVAAHTAILQPEKTFAVGKKGIIKFKVQGDWLYMRLPSGRFLAYYKPRLDGQGKITFLGVDTYTRRWCRTSTYGGKLTENAVQAISRDLLLHGMFNLDRAGYIIVGTVHDEVIMDLPNGFGSLEEAAEMLCDLEDWAEGIPVKAEGFEAQRYRK